MKISNYKPKNKLTFAFFVEYSLFSSDNFCQYDEKACLDFLLSLTRNVVEYYLSPNGDSQADHQFLNYLKHKTEQKHYLMCNTHPGNMRNSHSNFLTNNIQSEFQIIYLSFVDSLVKYASIN